MEDAPASDAAAPRRVHKLTTWRQFLDAGPAWDQLAARDPDGVLLSHDWAAQCWKCSAEIRAGEEPLVLVVWGKGQRPLAILPLRRNRRTRRICFLDEVRAQRLDLLAQPEHAPEAWASALTELHRSGGWDRFDLQSLRPESAEAVQAACLGLRLAVRERGRVRQRRLDLDRPWRAIETGFSPYLRANFRRRLRRLEARGIVRLDTLQTPDHLQPGLNACFALEKQGWKGAGATAIMDAPLQGRFYRQLAYRLAAGGALRLFCLWLDRELIAFEYCVFDRGSHRLSSLKIAYNEAFRTASPGTVLRWLLLRETLGQFSSYEFLGDDAPWKAEWTPAYIELRHLRIYNRTVGGYAWRARSRAYATWLNLRSGLSRGVQQR
ncbi:MAG TPA: GNAT family N-acetyltransferase [Terriglobales bacterium]|nr:GNAT family N-acetyltransferase [Terriglobales bacterium]